MEKMELLATKEREDPRVQQEVQERRASLERTVLRYEAVDFRPLDHRNTALNKYFTCFFVRVLMDLQGRLVLQGREVLWELQEPEERQA